MDSCQKRRMERNLARATAWLLASLAAVFLVELAWDAAADGAPPGGRDPVAQAASATAGAPHSPDAMLAFALEGDTAAVGASDGVPPDFTAECFSPAIVGEALQSDDGSVVALSSTLDAAEAFALCDDALQSHGWLKVDSGSQLRATFLKEAGRYRWLYLDAAPMPSTGTALIVLKGEA